MNQRKPLLAFLAASLLACVASAAELVTLTVRADKPGAIINPASYGQFAEHLGRLVLSEAP
jgi:hypothetical protein